MLIRFNKKAFFGTTIKIINCSNIKHKFRNMFGQDVLHIYSIKIWFKSLWSPRGFCRGTKRNTVFLNAATAGSLPIEDQRNVLAHPDKCLV